LLAAAAILSLIALMVRSASAAECPNKFGKQQEVSGGAADEEAARKELAGELKKALEREAADCKDKTCEEAKSKCRIVHTVTKVNCKPGPGAPAPAVICSQKYRPGCFCLREDEQIELRAIKRAGSAKGE
jgi:hypothetical protein